MKIVEIVENGLEESMCRWDGSESRRPDRPGQLSSPALQYHCASFLLLSYLTILLCSFTLCKTKTRIETILPLVLFLSHSFFHPPLEAPALTTRPLLLNITPLVIKVNPPSLPFLPLESTWLTSLFPPQHAYLPPSRWPTLPRTTKAHRHLRQTRVQRDMGVLHPPPP